MRGFSPFIGSCSEAEHFSLRLAFQQQNRKGYIRPLAAVPPKSTAHCDTEDQRIPPPTPWHPQASTGASLQSDGHQHVKAAQHAPHTNTPKARRSKHTSKQSSLKESSSPTQQQEAQAQPQLVNGENPFDANVSGSLSDESTGYTPILPSGSRLPDVSVPPAASHASHSSFIPTSTPSQNTVFSFQSTLPSTSSSTSSHPDRTPASHTSSLSASSAYPARPSSRPQHINVQKALTARLKSVSSLTELRALLQQQHNNFNGYHCATLTCRLAQLVEMRQVSPKEMRWMHGFLKQVTVLSRKHVSSMEPPQLAALWHSVAKLQVFDRVLLRRLQRLSLERMEEFSTKGLSLLVWAMARMQLKPMKEWMDAFYKVSAPLLPAFNVVELSTTIWGLATLNAHPPAAWRTLYLQCSTSQFPAMGPQALATTAWGPAALGWKVPAAWSEALLRASRKNLADCTPQGMTMILWAIAKLRIRPDQDWLQHHLTLTCNQMEQYNAQDLAQTMYSLVKLNAPMGSPFKEVFLQCSVQQLPRASRQAAANMLWGLASLGWQPSHSWMQTFYHHFQVHMTDCKPADLANVMWALARMSLQPRPAFLKAVLASAHTQSLLFQPQEITTLVWAFAKLGWQPTDELLLRLFVSTQGRLKQFQPQQLTNFLWAVAVLRKRPSDEWMKELYTSSSSRWSSYSPQGLTVSLWAVAQLKVQPPSEWLLSAASCCRERLHEFNALDLSLLVRALQTLIILPAAPDSHLMGLLVDTLDRLASMEVATAAYTRYALNKLLEFTPQQLSSRQRPFALDSPAAAATQSPTALRRPDNSLNSPSAAGSLAADQTNSVGSSSEVAPDLPLSPAASTWPVGTRYSSSLTQELITAIANTSHSILEEASSLQQQGRTNSRVLTSLRTAARKQTSQLIVQTTAEMTLDLEAITWKEEEVLTEWEPVNSAEKVVVAGSAA